MKHKTRRGVTLIEAVLFISIALGLIVGGIVFFQQASLASRVNTQVRVLSAIVQETRALYAQASTYNSLPAFDDFTIFSAGTRVDQVLIAAGAVPSTIITPPDGPFGAVLRNEWGNSILLSVGSLPGRQARLAILIDRIPRAACVRLAAIDEIGNGVFAESIDRIIFYDADDLGNGSFLSAPITPEAAAGPEGCGMSVSGDATMMYYVGLF